MKLNSLENQEVEETKTEEVFENMEHTFVPAEEHIPTSDFEQRTFTIKGLPIGTSIIDALNKVIIDLHNDNIIDAGEIMYPEGETFTELKRRISLIGFGD